MRNRLEQVTFETMKKFKKNNIVLPGDYSEEFIQNAVKLGYHPEDKTVLQDELKQDLQKLDKIFDQTSEGLTALSSSTTQAVDAIEKKDDKELLSIKQDIEALQSKVHSLQEELYTDSLTKVYNRRWFNEYYIKDDRFKKSGFMVFLDLNNFKQINDNYGHIVGDMVLKYLVVYLAKHLKSFDHYTVRYAGDEFIVVFDQNNSIIRLETLLQMVQKNLYKQKISVKNNDETTFSFTFSFGLSFFHQGDFMESILNKVDSQMYENKKTTKTQNDKMTIL